MAKFKKCFVPVCKNTSENAPEKLFIGLPIDVPRRKLWFETVGVRYTNSHRLYCCEDHFKLDEDVENWMYYKTIGDRLRLKPHVVPHHNITKHQIQVQAEKQFTLAARKQKLQVREALNRSKCGSPQRVLKKEYFLFVEDTASTSALSLTMGDCSEVGSPSGYHITEIQEL